MKSAHVAFALALAPAVIGAPSRTARARSIAYDALPASVPPAHSGLRAPARIEPHEKAEGFVFSANGDALLSSDDEARVWVAHGDAGAARACLRAREEDGPARRLLFARGAAPFVAWRERLDESATGPALETAVAFVDPKTRGVRLAGRARESLARVASGPGGFVVYAARALRVGEGAVRFVVRAPSAPSDASPSSRLWPLANHLSVRRENDAREATACGHVAFTLHAARGAGALATVTATAFLGPAVDPDDDHRGRAEPFVRARTFAAHLGISQVTGEPAPVVTATLAWCGADERYKVE